MAAAILYGAVISAVRLAVETLFEQCRPRVIGKSLTHLVGVHIECLGKLVIIELPVFLIRLRSVSCM
jgi:hypothetical protein